MFPLLRTIWGFVFGAIVLRVVGLFQRLTGQAEKKGVTRRHFTRNAALGATAVLLTELGLGFVRFFWNNKAGAFGSKLTVAKSDVPAVGADPYTYTPGKFYLMNLDEGLIALYWKCTHLGCTVPWKAAEDRFHCPCHGSVFLRNGVKESGPAPKPLDLFELEVLPTGDVEVNTGKIISRSEFTPDQAVPYTA